MSEATFKKKLAEARKRVAEMDAIDGGGFCSGLAVILEAIKCGIKCPKTEACFDAVIMLEPLARKEQQNYKEQRQNNRN